MYEDYPSSGGQHQAAVVIAAAPHDPVAAGLADELERLNVRVALVSDIEPYIGRMSACIVVLRPQTAHSSAVRVIFDARPPQLIPVLAVPMELPPGPWTTPPITLTRGAESAAYEIASALRGLRAPATRPMYPPEPEYPPAPGYPGYPPTPAYPGYPGYPTTPAYPSTPLYPMASGPGYPVPPYAPAAPAPRRSHALAWTIGSVAIALVVILAVVGGVLAVKRLGPQIAHQATATATVPANFTAYTDTHGLYRLNVPVGWSTTTESDVIVFGSPSHDAAFEVTSVNITMSADEMSATEQGFFKGADSGAGGNGTYSNLQGPTTVTIAGATWTREAADLTVKDGATFHAVVLIANHGSGALLVAYLAPSEHFASADSSAFQPMLNSFQFLK